jgi:hypothetical protein
VRGEIWLRAVPAGRSVGSRCTLATAAAVAVAAVLAACAVWRAAGPVGAAVLASCWSAAPLVGGSGGLFVSMPLRAVGLRVSQGRAAATCLWALVCDAQNVAALTLTMGFTRPCTPRCNAVRLPELGQIQRSRMSLHGHTSQQVAFVVCAAGGAAWCPTFGAELVEDECGAGWKQYVEHAFAFGNFPYLSVVRQC